MTSKLYAVYERVFIDHELMEVSQEMWTLEQIEAHIKRMTTVGWNYECEKDSTNNAYNLIFYL